jgi:hypothetical protein
VTATALRRRSGWRSESPWREGEGVGGGRVV